MIVRILGNRNYIIIISVGNDTKDHAEIKINYFPQQPPVNERWTWRLMFDKILSVENTR